MAIRTHAPSGHLKYKIIFLLALNEKHFDRSNDDFSLFTMTILYIGI